MGLEGSRGCRQEEKVARALFEPLSRGQDAHCLP